MDFSFFKNLFASSPAPKAEEAAGAQPGKEDVPADVPVGNVEVKSRRFGEPRGQRRRSERSGRRPVEGEVAALEPEEEAKVLSRLQEFVEYVATSLVEFPNEVSTEIVKKEDDNVIMISCAKKDAGKLIGKNGKIIASIRLLVSGAASRAGGRATVDICD